MISENLPYNWHAATFGDVLADISNGIPAPQNKESIGIPVSRIETIAAGKVNLSKIGYVSNVDEAEAERYLLAPGDILFSHINSPTHIGKTAIFRSGKLYHGTNLLRIKTERSVCTPEYFEYYCRYFRSVGEFSINAQHAVNQSSLNQKKIKAFLLPLAPLAEQTRIAAKLDELLAQVDTLKARTDGIPALLKRFRQSALAAAVSGRLTEEWRVQNCPTPPKAPSPNKYSLSMEELKTFADLHNLPHRWECASAAQICSSVRDGTHDTPAYHLSGIPLVTSKNIGSGFVDTTEAKLISIEDHLEISKRSLVEHGDVLFSMIGTVGNCCVVREQDSEFSIKNVGLFKKNESVILPRFLEFWLNSQVMWSWLEKNLKGSSQKFASLGTLRALPVFLPSLQEQTEIVRRVEQLFAFADQLEAKVASAKSRIDHLTQSLLAKAFRGELVPQDPNDEPASVLLERIKAQRAAAPKARRGRRAATPS